MSTRNKSDKHLTSIVMATYNQAQFLKVALLSCFNQTFDNYEVIVVSVEGDKETDVVLGNFPFPFHWVISERADYVYQRNLGIESAKGEWITLFDSDDFMLCNKLASEINVAKKEDALIVTSGFFICDENLNIKEAYIPPPKITREMLLQSCVITDLCMVHKSLYEEFGLFDVNYSEVAFYSHWLKVAEKYPDRIKTNQTPTFLYRTHPKQMHITLNHQWQMQMRQKVKEESLRRKPI